MPSAHVPRRRWQLQHRIRPLPWDTRPTIAASTACVHLPRWRSALPAIGRGCGGGGGCVASPKNEGVEDARGAALAVEAAQDVCMR